MRNEKLERAIVRIDNDLAAMNVAKKYLSNLDEINTVRDELNNKRQNLANELYSDDNNSYLKCTKIMVDMLDRELGQEEQVELLEIIKEKFGRQSPNASRKSSGLNAWLKDLNIEYNWVTSEESDWDTLVITGFAQYRQG